MRNLKKVLALVLALVMAMSLVTIANASDFVDADDITYDEAVDVLTALKVIEGVGNNTFNPNGNVTRAQMAKMITIISLGNVEPDAFLGTTTDLTDINGHWAEAYIKYCYSQGIISGKGAGIFDPNANVTSAEAAKMLLVAIGYNSSVQGYTGAQWTINVTRDAQTSKFYEDLSVPANQALTRDQAAQLIYNAIQATMIEKTSTVDRVDGSITDTYAPYDEAAHTLLRETFGAKTFIGTFRGDYNTGAATVKGEIAVYGRLDSENTGDRTARFPYSFDLSNIGEEVKVIFKDGTGGISGSPDKKDTIYGVFNTNTTVVYTTTKAGIDTTDSTVKADEIKFDGATYKVADATTTATTAIVRNYGAKDAVIVDSDGTPQTNLNTANPLFTTYKAAFNALSAQSGDTIKFICNDDGEIDMAYVVESTLSKVTAVTSEKVSLYGIGSITIADNEIYDGAAKDDVVTVTKLYDTVVADATFVVEKAETVEGKITAYLNKDGNNTTPSKVTIDGTEYKIEGYGLSTGLTNDVITDLTDNVGTTVIAYLVNGMVDALQQTSDTVYTYALVLDDNNQTTAGVNVGKVQLLLADNTKVIYDVNKDSYWQAAGTYALAAGDLVKYYLKSDNTMVIDENNKIDGSKGGPNYEDGYTGTPTATVWDEDTKVVTNGTHKAVAANDCVAFVLTAAGTYKAYNIRDLQDIALTGQTINYAVNSNGQVVAVYIALNAVPAGGSSKMTYGMVLAQLGSTKLDNDYYTQYSIWTGEDTITVSIEGQTTNALTKGTMYAFSRTSTDRYENATLFDALNMGDANVLDVAIKEHLESDSTLSYYKGVTLNGTSGVYDGTGLETRVIDDDAKIIYINAKDDVAGDNIGLTPFNAQTGYANAKLVIDGGKIVAIFVETSGDVDVNGTTNVAATVVAPTANATNDRTAIDAALAANGSVIVTGDVTLDSTALTNLTAGRTLIVEGDLTLAAAQSFAGDLIVNGDLNGDFAVTVTGEGSLTVTGNVASSTTGLTVTGTSATQTASATIGGTLAKLANVTNGNVTIGGAVTTVTNITSGTVAFNGAVTTVTNITGGTVSFKTTVTTVTDITGGDVTFNGAASIVAITGTNDTKLNINSNVTLQPTSAFTATNKTTFNVGAAGTLTLDGTSQTISIAAAALKGVAGAKVVLANVGTNGVTVAANQLFKIDGTSETAGALSIAATYVYGAAKGTMASDGFIANA